MLIATAALLPARLWAAGVVPGLPILPLHTLALLWAFALPLIAGHPEMANYGDEEIFFSASCVAIYALLGTAAWAMVATRPLRRRETYYVLPSDRGFAFLVAFIFSGGAFITLAIGQLIDLSPGLFGLVRSSILAFASIALFVLSVRLARGTLNQAQRWLFLGAAAFYVVVQLATLYLVGSIISVASALIGYTIGRGRVPWITIMAALLLFGFLHSGKGEMRDRYWGSDAPPVALHELPVFFAEWIAAGASELRGGEETFGSQPIYERVSLMHMLLLAQHSAPDYVPYLDGATYAIIPALLVPRIINPDKPDSHQGTSMLNIQFGLQSVEDTERTTVAWGLLTEAYANFGLLGVAAVAVLLGALFGYVCRITAGAPVMSLENMVGVTFAAVAIQGEFTMAVFVTVLFQSLAVLLLVLPFLEKRSADKAD